MGRLGASAIAYARLGWPVFPCAPGGKTPITEHGFKNASADPDLAASLWARSPQANIGLACGDIFVLDVDAKQDNGFETLAGLLSQFGPLPETPFQQTGTGEHGRGRQFYFDGRGLGLRNFQGRLKNNKPGPLGFGIDGRGAGGYSILAPSLHPSGINYEWHTAYRPSKIALAPVPAWIVAALAKPKISEQASVPRPDWSEVPEAYGRSALEGEYSAVARTGKGGRNQALNAAAFSLGQLVADDIVRRTDVENALTAAASENGYLAEEGAEHVAKVIRSGIESGMQNPRAIKPAPAVSAPPKKSRAEVRQTMRVVTQEKPEGEQVAPDPADDDEPSRDYVLDTKGEFKPGSIHNATRLLQETAALQGLFAHDDFSGQVMVTRRPPWTLNGHVGGAVTDADVTGCAGYLERKGFSIGLASLHAAVGFVAQENHINPVRDAVAALEWDGSARLDNWLCDYLGAAETHFVRTVASKFLIGAVARIMKPGAKVDTMLILEGPQGLKKSTALATLATIGGVEYFADKLPALGSKDAALELQGKIIIELAELDAMHKAEVSQIKAWLSQRIDRFRPPYGRAVVERPRQCVFAGTVNPGATGYLNDPTGGRRFWPVSVAKVDLSDLRSVTPQLWAEAAHRYREGERWWLDDDAVVNDARTAQRDRYAQDVWGDRIDRYIRSKLQVRVSEILEAELELPKHLWTDAASKRVGAHLRFRGWQRRKWRDPLRDHHPTWYFFPPDEEQEDDAAE